MSRAAAQRIRVAAGPFRIHVDQAHLHGAERPGELPVAAVALVSQPGVLRAPEDLLGLPDVGPAEAEAERLEPHRFHGHVAGQDQQIGPGDLLAVLLLDRPEQPARLVEVRVVGPAVEGRKALLAVAATAAAVGDAVGAGGMPRHADEERAVVAVVGRPPVLRRRHQLDEVPLQRVEVEGLELFGVVEVLFHRIGQVRVLVEHRQVQLIRPPVLVGPRPSPLGSRRGDCRVLAFADASCLFLIRHVDPSPLWVCSCAGGFLSTMSWRRDQLASSGKSDDHTTSRSRGVSPGNSERSARPAAVSLSQRRPPSAARTRTGGCLPR